MVMIVGMGAAAADGPAGNIPYDVIGTEESPNLYQRSGRSEFACLATLVEDSHYARFQVEEVYAGQSDSAEIQVVYRGMSWSRLVEGQSRIRFKEGERYLLFLRYYREHGRPVRPDLFELMDGSWGKIRLDGENEPLFVDAMRLLLAVTSRPDLVQRHRVLLGLLGSDNQLAAGAAMYQVAQAGLGQMEHIPLLLKQMDRGIAGLKMGSLQILRRMGPTLPSSIDIGAVAASIHARIDWSGGDPVDVRMAAVKTLMAMGEPAAPSIELVSRQDANQAVRYEAAVWLVDAKG